VTILTVGGNQTFFVYRNGTTIVNNQTWEHLGTQGTIEIYPETSNLILGTYNVSITVNNGLGHSISDDVFMAVIEPAGISNLWVYIIAIGIFSALFLVTYFNRRRLTKQLESANLEE
jgi:hypothetical protein